jgi:zinc/manganese transport system permease protein
VWRALGAGVVIAILSSIVGFFTLVRRQAFAGHALTDVATTGGSAASVIAISPLLGFFAGALLGAGALGALGDERVRERDIATGVVLGVATGGSALFLYLSATSSSDANATQHILFGSLFSVSPFEIFAIVIATALCVALVARTARSLLLSSIAPTIAAARGVSVRARSMLFLLVLCVTVTLSALVTGTILSTALLIGPAASAQRLTASPLRTIVLASTFATFSTVVGVILAYDSYYWNGNGAGLPVSCFIVMAIVVLYAATGLAQRRRGS